MTDLEKDKILLLAHSIGKMARELQSIKGLLKEIADASQTERIKTLDYCDICNHKGCDNCIANNLDDYCVPSGYEPTTQTETQNSNLTFEKRTMRDCYNCKRYETEDECIECKFEPKDEPTISKMEQVDEDINVRSKDEPQTETEIAKATVHKMIDDAVIAEDAYPDLRQKMHDAVDEYEPQTERSRR